MRQKILVVDDEPDTLTGMVEILAGAGFNASGAATFEEGRRLLTETAPDLLIVDIRLGDFNGLHLVLRGYFERPNMAAIVTTGFPDPVLESEALRYGARFLLKPVDPQELIAVACDVLRAHRRLDRRRWPRTRLVRELKGLTDATEATVVDVSYGGFRFSVPNSAPVPTGAFLLGLPGLGVRVHAGRVWAQRDRACGLEWCGAEIVEDDAVVLAAWHQAVHLLLPAGAV